MKRKFTALLSFILVVSLLLSACSDKSEDPLNDTEKNNDEVPSADEQRHGEELEALGAYDGYFEGESTDVVISFISGTEGCYTLDGSTLTFSGISDDSVYSISGKLNGNIVIDVGDDYKFDLEMQGFSLVCSGTNPVVVKSGNEVSLTAKRDFKNYIYDERVASDGSDDTYLSGAVHSEVDLEICGKGELYVVSENNNGIHTKDDLQVKNLTLLVSCVDNALKGNDSVEITSATTTLIAKKGDGIKTSNSDISDKGNQRGTVSIMGGMHNIYAACDGIDAAYDVLIDSAETVLNIYTDKYSSYSEELTAVSEDVYYIRFSSSSYKYSVKYYNSDSDFLWVNAEYHSAVSGMPRSYYYYSFPKKSEYAKMKFFIYSSDMEQASENDYLAATDYLSPSDGYDTFAIESRGNSLSCGWTNYTTSIAAGPGAMQDGNGDKGDYSTKGIKAANSITISAGSITVKSYDDAIHANADSTLENGEAATGNVKLSGGNVTLYSNDDGLHADGTLAISSGTVCVSNSYEGLEGNTVLISGGSISVISSDDGINATATSGTSIEISGGTVYVYAGGDGIDSNSTTSYSGIVFCGGNTTIISTSAGNSAIDSEGGYRHTGGSVVAFMPSGGMTSEALKCQSFSSVGTSKSVSVSEGKLLTVTVGGSLRAAVKMPVGISGLAIYLGSASATIGSENSVSEALDSNGIFWSAA